MINSLQKQFIRDIFFKLKITQKSDFDKLGEVLAKPSIKNYDIFDISFIIDGQKAGTSKPNFEGVFLIYKSSLRTETVSSKYKSNM